MANLDNPFLGHLKQKNRAARGPLTKIKPQAMMIIDRKPVGNMYVDGHPSIKCRLRVVNVPGHSNLEISFIIRYALPPSKELHQTSAYYHIYRPHKMPTLIPIRRLGTNNAPALEGAIPPPEWLAGIDKNFQNRLDHDNYWMYIIPRTGLVTDCNVLNRPSYSTGRKGQFPPSFGCLESEVEKIRTFLRTDKPLTLLIKEIRMDEVHNGLLKAWSSEPPNPLVTKALRQVGKSPATEQRPCIDNVDVPNRDHSAEPQAMDEKKGEDIWLGSGKGVAPWENEAQPFWI